MKILAILAILSVLACNKSPECENFRKINAKVEQNRWDKETSYKLLKGNWKYSEYCASEESFTSTFKDKSSDSIEFNFVNDSTVVISKNKQVINKMGYTLYERFVDDGVFTLSFESEIYDLIDKEYRLLISEDVFLINKQGSHSMLFTRTSPSTPTAN